MTDQLTDEYLAKRAEEIAMEVLPHDTGVDGLSSSEQNARRQSYKFATLSALKVHRDGLPYMQHKPTCNKWIVDDCGWHDTLDDKRGCTCGLDQHIASLRELLGVSQ